MAPEIVGKKLYEGKQLTARIYILKPWNEKKALNFLKKTLELCDWTLCGDGSFAIGFCLNVESKQALDLWIFNGLTESKPNIMPKRIQENSSDGRLKIDIPNTFTKPELKILGYELEYFDNCSIKCGGGLERFIDKFPDQT